MKFLLSRIRKMYDLVKSTAKHPKSSLSAFVYQGYSILKKKLTLSNIIASIATIFGVLFLIERGYYEQTKLTSIVVSTLLLLAYLTSYLIVRFKIKNTGVHSVFKLPRTYIRRLTHGLFFIDINNIDKEKFRMAEKHDAATSAVINMKGFEGGVWGTDFYDKYLRNKSHILRNKNSIMLIRSKSADEYIGFTHILPVNERIWKSYTLGKIKDNTFKAENIAPIDHIGYEEPFGLILFGVAIPFEDEDYSEYSIPKEEYLGNLIEQAQAYHINILLESMFNGQKKVPVLFQNYDDAFLEHFEKEALNEPMMSADKVPIFVFNVTNNIAVKKDFDQMNRV